MASQELLQRVDNYIAEHLYMRKNKLCINWKIPDKEIYDVITNDMGATWHWHEEGWCLRVVEQIEVIDIYAKYGRISSQDRLKRGVCFELYAELKPYMNKECRNKSKELEPYMFVEAHHRKHSPTEQYIDIDGYENYYTEHEMNNVKRYLESNGWTKDELGLYRHRGKLNLIHIKLQCGYKFAPGHFR